jgi:hypothetical protein
MVVRKYAGVSAVIELGRVTATPRDASSLCYDFPMHRSRMRTPIVDHKTAMKLLRRIRSGGRPIPVGFLSPIIVTMLAAEAANEPRLGYRLRERIALQLAQKSYAANCGLQAVLDGQDAPRSLAGLEGVTYTRLTRLVSGHEVDACNAVINNLFDEQLCENGGDFIRVLGKVVGEMHDNVASRGLSLAFASPP